MIAQRDMGQIKQQTELAMQGRNAKLSLYLFQDRGLGFRIL